MSFLLDALGKADEDRRRAEVPELRTHRQAYRSPWRRVLSGLLILILLMLSFASGYMLRPSLDGIFTSQTVSTERLTPAVSASPASGEPVIVSPDVNSQTSMPVDVQEASIPGLELEVISYSENPSARFVMINGMVLHEGDELQTGERLMVIERDAVVLDKAGAAVRVEM